MNIYELNYQKMLPYINDMMGTAKRYKKFTSTEGFMPLVIERLNSRDDGCYRFSITHYLKHNGDLMADPDMEFEVNVVNKTIEALTYQNDTLGVFQEIYVEENGKYYSRPQLKKHFNDFLGKWLDNIKNQNYILYEVRE